MKFNNMEIKNILNTKVKDEPKDNPESKVDDGQTRADQKGNNSCS